MKAHNHFSLFSSHFSFRLWPLIAGLIAVAVYWLTVDPAASYWDCPEYLMTALRLEVGHAPGNPGWSLTHRFVTSFFTNPATQVLVVNLMSGLFTALAVMLLCSVTITIMRWCFPLLSLIKRIGGNTESIIGIAATAASLCFAFSDSAWYSAVEAEVYAMSLFLSSLTIWMSLKWVFTFSGAARARLLIALFYIIGFSLGVHQLNLLALPAIAMIMASGLRKWKDRLLFRRAVAFIIGCVVVLVILKGIMPGSLALAEAADVFFVNTLGLPFWSGAVTFWLLAIILVLVLAFISNHSTLNIQYSTFFFSLVALMLGYSVYIIIPIRAWANPPINEGNPSTVPRFADYLDRRQYGGAPLFYGQTPYSKNMRIERISVNENGDTVYDYSLNAIKVRSKDMRCMVKGGHIPDRSRFLTNADKDLNRRLSADSSAHGYAVAGFRSQQIRTPELDMLFPRIHSSAPDKLAAYRDWSGLDSSNMVRVRISEAFDSLGNPVPMRDSKGNKIERFSFRPTYLQSLTFLTSYQIGYMYLRYLMWNYSGRQNDVPATGEIDHGNFITGIPAVDDLMLCDSQSMPREIGEDNEGHNVYFAIPLILGIIGIVWLFCGRNNDLSVKNMRNAAWYSLTLFLMTGVAIVVYLNQIPGEPRERDYSFLGSFWVFAIWIAFGMLYMLLLAKKKWQRAIMMLFVCAVPLWMLAQNYGDHDRSGRSATLDFATNMLMSLDKDAILFLNGDNYIFPVWYAQEVMGVRRDVSVVCSSYLGSDWYLPQLMTERYGYEGIRTTATEGDIALGNFSIIRMSKADSDTMSACQVLRELYADRSPIPSLRHRYLVMGKDSTDQWIFDLLSIPGKQANSFVGLAEVATIDIIATNAASRYPRPIYWQQNLSARKFHGFKPYTRQALFTRKLMPLASDSLILTEEALNALPHLKWGGIDRMPYPGPDVTLQAVNQRSSLIRLAESLGDEGRHDQALHVARSAMVRFSASVIPYSIRGHADSIYWEARQLAFVLKRSGDALGDTAAISTAQRILYSDSLRIDAYRRYRKSIPANRRHAISPATNNHSILH